MNLCIECGIDLGRTVNFLCEHCETAAKELGFPLGTPGQYLDAKRDEQGYGEIVDE